MFLATTTICDDEERDERVDDLERERERERDLSRSGCESERAFFFFSVKAESCFRVRFFYSPTDLRSGFD